MGGELPEPGRNPRTDPPRWLQAGDVVEISCPELGMLRNPVVDEA